MVASINLLFIVWFGSLLALAFSCIMAGYIMKALTNALLIIPIVICFYAPTLLQTLLILLMWPINFYFVKTCVFVLVLSLTRNISYVADEAPDDFLATSTAYVKYRIRLLIDRMR